MGPGLTYQMFIGVDLTLNDASLLLPTDPTPTVTLEMGALSGFGGLVGTITGTPVPEPGTGLLALAGLAGLGLAGRWRSARC